MDNTKYLNKVSKGSYWNRYPPSGDGTSTPDLEAMNRHKTSNPIATRGTIIVINWNLSGEVPCFGPMKVNIELQKRIV